MHVQKGFGGSEDGGRDIQKVKADITAKLFAARDSLRGGPKAAMVKLPDSGALSQMVRDLTKRVAADSKTAKNVELILELEGVAELLKQNGVEKEGLCDHWRAAVGGLQDRVRSMNTLKGKQKLEPYTAFRDTVGKIAKDTDEIMHALAQCITEDDNEALNREIVSFIATHRSWQDAMEKLPEPAQISFNAAGVPPRK